VYVLCIHYSHLADDILVIASGQVPDHDEIRARVSRAVMDMEASASAFYANTIQRGIRTKSPATTRIKKRSAPAAEPSQSTPAAMSAVVSTPTPRLLPNSRETAIISKIRRGTGISSYELHGLLERCGICEKYFTGSVLCYHIFLCSRG
jgi:hypothetical protein